MTFYKLNPPLPIEVQKEDLVRLIHDLGMIFLQLTEVQRSLPDSTGDMRIKQRLSLALKCTENLKDYFCSEYMP